MTICHILIDPESETIVNILRIDEYTGLKDLRRFIKHHTAERGRPLARVIIKRGSPVKVVQAGEETPGDEK